MTQVSKIPLKKEVYDRILEIFFKSIVDIKSSREAELFLKDFFSPTETIMMAKRLAIAILLAKNYDHRSIRRILRVSPSTISSVRKTMRYAGDGYKKFIKKIIREDSIKKFFLDLGGGVTEVLSNVGKGGAAWFDLNQTIKKEQRKEI